VLPAGVLIVVTLLTSSKWSCRLFLVTMALWVFGASGVYGGSFCELL
jgi:hypothetical protein